MRGVIVLLLAACLQLLLTQAAAGDRVFVDPYGVESASGEWVLRIDPSHHEGAGGARYTMLRHGEVAWEAEHEHTLRECVVSNAGMAIGYAYDNGYMGRGGNLIVMLIDSEGEIIAAEKHERRIAMRSNPPSAAYPIGTGVLLDEVGRRAIIRLTLRKDMEYSPQSPQWLIYSLDTGRYIGTRAPVAPVRGERGFGFELDAWSIPATDLIIVHWIVYEQGAPMAVFEVIDDAGEVVWSRRIEQEYAERPRGWLGQDLRRDRVRQVEVEPKVFAIVSYADGERTRYTVSSTAAGQSLISEAAPEEAVPTADLGPLGQVEPMLGRLERLGDVTLGSPQDDSVIKGIHAMSFDDRGRIGWIPSDLHAPNDTRFCMVERDGTTVGVIPLDLPDAKPATRPVALWLNDDRWLIARAVLNDENKACGEAWFLDTANGELTPIPDFDTGRIHNLARTPTGDFAVRADRTGDFSSEKTFQRYGTDGRLLGESVVNPTNNDMTILSDGTLAWISTSGHITLQKHGEASADGWSVPVRLGYAGMNRHGYFTTLRADRDGGLLVVESTMNGSLIHRFDQDGTPRQTFRALGPDGEKFRVHSAIAVDPDGHVWASDGSRLYRYDAEGRADLALGGPAQGTMAQPVAVTVDDHGWIYAVERGTAAVHVFDAQGQPIRVMKPEPGDTTTQDMGAWIAVAPDGGVRYRMNMLGPIVSFDFEGNRIGVQSHGADTGFGGDNRREIGRGWKHNFVSVRRTNEQGEVIVNTRYRPDGGWIVAVQRAATGPDGSLAVLCIRRDPHAFFAGYEPAAIFVYGPDGEGQGIIELQRHTRTDHPFAYDGQRVSLTDPSGLTVFQTPLDPKTPATRYNIEGPDGAYWTVIPRPNGIVSTWQHGTRSVNHWRLIE